MNLTVYNSLMATRGDRNGRPRQICPLIDSREIPWQPHPLSLGTECRVCTARDVRAKWRKCNSFDSRGFNSTAATSGVQRGDNWMGAVGKGLEGLPFRDMHVHCSNAALQCEIACAVLILSQFFSRQFRVALTAIACR